MQSAMASSVPSPPSTSTMSTLRASVGLSRTTRDEDGVKSAAVSVSNTAVTSRPLSHSLISTR